MKKLVTMFCLLALASSVVAQEYTCLWGINFGSSKEAVQEQIERERGLSPDGETSPDILVYSNCEFSGENAKSVYFQFVNDKLYAGKVFINPPLESLVFTTYNKFKENLTLKYGTPHPTAASFKKPYKEGDGHEVRAIKDQKASFYSFWKLPNEDDIRYQISLTITPDVKVALSYEDERLKVIVGNTRKKKAISDL